MTINIKMMTEEAYKTLQKNYKEVYEEILKHPSDCTWLSSYLGFEPFEIKKYEVEDFELKNSEDYSDVALDNAITMFETFKDLPRYILCNIRFWAWVSFEKAYKQSLNSTKLNNAETLKNLWLPSSNKQGDEVYASRRSLMLGVISRYFFMVEVSKDETLDDKYDLTKFLIKSNEAYRNITYRNIGMLSNITLGYIKALRDFSIDKNTVITKAHARELFKETSRLGSVMLIDLLSKEEVYEMLYPKLEDIHNAILNDDK